jgi:hypothetical protein
MKCWDSFVGPPGRSKDVGLFYIFALLDSEEIRWTSRRLPMSISRTSHQASETPSIPPSGSSRQTGGRPLTVTQMRQLDYYTGSRPSSAFSPSLAAPQSQAVVDHALSDSRKRVYDSKAEVHAQESASLRSTRLEQAMIHEQFNELGEEERLAVRARWLRNLTEN